MNGQTFPLLHHHYYIITREHCNRLHCPLICSARVRRILYVPKPKLIARYSCNYSLMSGSWCKSPASVANSGCVLTHNLWKMTMTYSKQLQVYLRNCFATSAMTPRYGYAIDMLRIHYWYSTTTLLLLKCYC